MWIDFFESLGDSGFHIGCVLINAFGHFVTEGVELLRVDDVEWDLLFLFLFGLLLEHQVEWAVIFLRAVALHA